MGILNITPDQCKIFPGAWSIKPEQMYVALSNVTFTDKLKILEFGAGAGTHALAKLLTTMNVPFDYTSYEDNPAYVCNRPDVRTIMWSRITSAIAPMLKVAHIFDLVIIDGPAGLRRVRWYPMLQPVVREGTILLIDDFRHFKSFNKALRQNFIHEPVKEDTQPRIPGAGQISWLVTRIKSPRGRK